MKLLALHVDYIKFKPLKKALKKISELSEKEKEGGNVKEGLVVLTAVEKSDKDVGKVVEAFVENVKDIAKKVKAKNIILYPYAHLSNNLSSPDVAVKVLDEAEKVLKKDFKVVKAPFGYYKEFELKVKGHPLSELSREIKIEGEAPLGAPLMGREEYDSKQLLREISKSRLDTSKLKDNDHRIIGQQMDLFSFSEVAPGMVFWHNNGLIIRKELINFWREIHQKVGYEEISTPQIMDKKLWQISGHWEKYKENIFLTEYEKRQFVVKPMNCPGGMLVFKNRPKSYKDLPLRVGELGIVHRQELSGVLGGLFRVIQFTQDDAHIFCNEKQLEKEILGVCISGHPVDAFEESKNGDFTSFKSLKDDMETDVFGLVKRCTKIVTKNGDDMAFIDVVSKSGNLKVTVFPKYFKECFSDGFVDVGDGVRINGRFKESDEFGDAFVAKNILVCEAKK